MDRSASIIGSLTAMAQTGGLDGTLLSEGQFYNTNYTKPLLFIADGTYLANRPAHNTSRAASGE